MKPITTTTVIFDKRAPMAPRLYSSHQLDPRGDLAKCLLSTSFMMPKYNGMNEPAELQDVPTLVQRAFDAADAFYKEAAKRDCLVEAPPYDEVVAANDADIERLDARKKAERDDADRRQREAEARMAERYDEREAKANDEREERRAARA